MENNENKKDNFISQECKRLLVIGLMTFLGAFLAFYVLIHQTMFHYLKKHHPAPIFNEKYFDKLEDSLEKNIKENFNKYENKETSKFKNKVSAVQTLKYEDAYIIVVNLKPFNNNEENIRFSVNGNTATVSGNIVKNKHNGNNAYYFTESFEIPEKININEIQKEKINDKYIITLPIEN